jgi:hypothetical protein
MSAAESDPRPLVRAELAGVDGIDLDAVTDRVMAYPEPIALACTIARYDDRLFLDWALAYGADLAQVRAAADLYFETNGEL